MASDIAEYLEDQGVGTVGTDIFCEGLMPSAPSQCILVSEYGGMAPDTTHDGKTIKRPGLQVLTRADRGGYIAGKALADSVQDALHALANTTIESTFYLSIFAEQAPTFIGRDAKQNGRPMWSQNFAVMKR